MLKFGTKNHFFTSAMYVKTKIIITFAHQKNSTNKMAMKRTLWQ